jgi:uncharacterized HAD superfamily protein
MNPYIICDLDGTLCLIEHRLHFIEGKNKKWEEFFSHLDEDELNKPVDYILKHFENIKIIFISGRPEEYREKTEVWLKKYKLTEYKLYMRSTGDYRQDSIIKEEIYKNKIEPQLGQPLFILDDRDQVVVMWRSLGLACFQVREGNY